MQNGPSVDSSFVHNSNTSSTPPPQPFFLSQNTLVPAPQLLHQRTSSSQQQRRASATSISSLSSEVSSTEGAGLSVPAAASSTSALPLPSKRQSLSAIEKQLDSKSLITPSSAAAAAAGSNTSQHQEFPSSPKKASSAHHSRTASSVLGIGIKGGKRRTSQREEKQPLFSSGEVGEGGAPFDSNGSFSSNASSTLASRTASHGPIGGGGGGSTSAAAAASSGGGIHIELGVIVSSESNQGGGQGAASSTSLSHQQQKPSSPSSQTIASNTASSAAIPPTYPRLVNTAAAVVTATTASTSPRVPSPTHPRAASITLHNLYSNTSMDPYNNAVAIINPKSGERQASDYVYDSLVELFDGSRERVHRLEATSFRDTSSMKALVKKHCVWFVEDIVSGVAIEDAMAEVELMDGSLDKVLPNNGHSNGDGVDGTSASANTANGGGVSLASAAANKNTESGIVLLASDESRSTFNSNSNNVGVSGRDGVGSDANNILAAAGASLRRGGQRGGITNNNGNSGSAEEERGTVIVAGGDGTVCFIMSMVDEVKEELLPKAEAARRDNLRMAVRRFLAAHPTFIPTTRNSKGQTIMSDASLTTSAQRASPSSSPSSASGGMMAAAAHHHHNNNNTIAYGSPRIIMPAIGVIAMGTGNDFSNSLGFGLGYTKYPAPPCCFCCCDCCIHRVKDIVDALVTKAEAVPFDRWHVTVTPIRDLVTDVVTEAEFDVASSVIASQTATASSSSPLPPPSNASHHTLSISFDAQQMGKGTLRRVAQQQQRINAAATHSPPTLTMAALSNKNTNAANANAKGEGAALSSSLGTAKSMSTIVNTSALSRGGGGEIAMGGASCANSTEVLRLALHKGDSATLAPKPPLREEGEGGGGEEVDHLDDIDDDDTPHARLCALNRGKHVVTVDTQKLRRHQHGALQAGLIGSGGSVSFGNAALSSASGTYTFVKGEGSGTPLPNTLAAAAVPPQLPLSSSPSLSLTATTTAVVVGCRTPSCLVVEDAEKKRRAVLVAHDASTVMSPTAAQKRHIDSIHNNDVVTASPTSILSPPSRSAFENEESDKKKKKKSATVANLSRPDKGPKPLRQFVAMNYFSLGMDALIATTFDTLRKKYPSMFNARVMNKMWYGSLGLYGWAKSDRLNDSIYYIDVATEEGVLTAPRRSGDSCSYSSSASSSPHLLLPPPISKRELLRRKRKVFEAKKAQLLKSSAVMPMVKKNNREEGQGEEGKGSEGPAHKAVTPSYSPREEGAANNDDDEDKLDQDIVAAMDGVVAESDAVLNDDEKAKPIQQDPILEPSAEVPDDALRAADAAAIDESAIFNSIAPHEYDPTHIDDSHIPLPNPTPITFPSKSKCLVLSNVGSYSGGAKLWSAGSSKKVKKVEQQREHLLTRIRNGSAAVTPVVSQRNNALMRTGLGSGGGGGNHHNGNGATGTGGEGNADQPLRASTVAVRGSTFGGGGGGGADSNGGDAAAVTTEDGTVAIDAAAAIAAGAMSNPLESLSPEEIALLNGAEGHTNVSTLDGRIEMQAVGGLLDMMLLQAKMTPTTRMAQSQVVRIVVGHPQHHPAKVAARVSALVEELARKEKHLEKDLEPSAKKIAVKQYQTQAKLEQKKAKNGNRANSNDANASPSPSTPSPSYLDPSQKHALIEKHYRAIMSSDKDIVACRERIEAIKALLDVVPDWAVRGDGGEDGEGGITAMGRGNGSYSGADAAAAAFAPSPTAWSPSPLTASAGGGGAVVSRANNANVGYAPPPSNIDIIKHALSMMAGEGGKGRKKCKTVADIASHRPNSLEEALAAAIHCAIPDAETMPHIKHAASSSNGNAGGGTNGGANSNNNKASDHHSSTGIIASSSSPSLSLNATFEKPVCFQVDGEPSGFITEPCLIEVRPYPKEMLVRSLTHHGFKK